MSLPVTPPPTDPDAEYIRAAEFYPKLTRHLRTYWIAGSNSKEALGPAATDVWQRSLYNGVITAIITRTTEGLHPRLLEWAGHILLTGQDLMYAGTHTASPTSSIPGEWEGLKEVWNMGRRLIENLTDNRNHGCFRRLPMTPHEALLYTARFEVPSSYMAYGVAAACLMSVFTDEDDAIRYFETEINT